MNVCIVKEDRAVMIDGETMNFDFILADNIWAIQWNGTSGHIEYNDGTLNENITDISAFQSIIDGHATEKQRIADEEASRVSNMTYTEKRAGAYPSTGDQLDMMYHDAIDGTTTWQDAVTAVKNQYPKS